MTEAQKCLYHIAENMRMDKSISKEGYEYFQQAIRALEQEPILDKVRAEIEAIAFDWQEIDGKHESFMVVDLNEALQIIDKYKAESEKKRASVLDKISAEIAHEIIPRNSDQYDHEAMWQNLGLRMALKVIDKHKAEQGET